MALVFTVGNPSDALNEPFAERVRRTIEKCFGNSMDLQSADDPWYSEELGWSGWRALQDRAKDIISAEHIPHLLCMPAWQGVYVLADTEPGCFQFDDDEDLTIVVGSLIQLEEEIRLVGKSLGWPTDGAELIALAEKYLSNDDLIDEDMDIQTYAQLAIGIAAAKRRKQPLWVVK